MKIESDISEKFDFFLFFTVLALIIIGLIAIYSSTLHNPFAKGNFLKQILALFVGLIAFFSIYSAPTNWLRSATLPAYGVSIFLLLLVLVIGRIAGGAKGWIRIGGFGLQPAEFAKIATILAISQYTSKSTVNIDTIKDLGISLIIGLFPVALIMLEPDLGSSFVFFTLILVLLLWKGISLFGLFVVLSPAMVAISSLFGMYYVIGSLVLVGIALLLFRRDLFLSITILAFNIASAFFVDFVMGILSPHQRKRIFSFLNPELDPLGSGYNALQAQIAIGSGGLFGKGFLQGNQTQNQFIPEQWTDFIYCTIGEEFGFIGAIVVFTIFALFFYRLFRHATSNTHEYHSLIVIGIFSVYFIHFVINLGMAIGMMPVIGIPLPFISYGGSSLLVNLSMLGIVQNIYKSRKQHV